MKTTTSNKHRGTHTAGGHHVCKCMHHVCGRGQNLLETCIQLRLRLPVVKPECHFQMQCNFLYVYEKEMYVEPNIASFHAVGNEETAVLIKISHDAQPMYTSNFTSCPLEVTSFWHLNELETFICHRNVSIVSLN